MCIETSLQSALHTPVLPTADSTKGMFLSAVVNLLLCAVDIHTLVAIAVF